MPYPESDFCNVRGSKIGARPQCLRSILFCSLLYVAVFTLLYKYQQSSLCSSNKSSTTTSASSRGGIRTAVVMLKPF